MEIKKPRTGLLLALLLSGCQLTQPPQDVTAAAESDPPRLQTQQPPRTTPTVSAADTEPAKESNTSPSGALSPAEQEDLWQRIALQLTLPIPEERQIAAQRDWYLQHVNYMRRITERAEPFLYDIVVEVERRGLPLELAMLPIVESAFDPFAYSHGGAAGLWQFMPATGQRFKLAQNWWYDGRRDVRASTLAALDYLEYLNGLFEGNWLHALAAYNSGEGRVLNAIKRNRRHGKPTDFWNLSLPRETRAYVPKLLALSDIMQHPDRYGLSFPTLPNRPSVTEVEVGSQIDLALAAKLAGIELRELQRLNPGFSRWATAPEGPHRLLLPLNKARPFELALADTPSSERLQWQRYVVQSGDTLSTIAARFGTRTDVLKKANQLNTSLIRTKQPLLIPVSLNNLDEYAPLDRPRRNNAKPAHIHKVKAGDTLWDISQAYQVNVKDVARWNGIATSSPLRPGQELTIYTSAAPSKGVQRTVTYEVRSGDSLSVIAAKFGVQVVDLIRWNQLDREQYLQPGQTLKVIVAITEV